jgi:hypothetical protein
MKNILLSILVATLGVFVPVLLPASAYAACPSSSGASTPKDQVLVGVGETGGNCSGSGVNNIVNTAVEVLSIVVGIVAIIMIMVAGFKYLTSAGDANKVGSAKNTLIYALVGVAVAALAQFLVHFVLHQANNA